MRTFQDMSAEEGLSYGLGLLCRCTLPGQDPAFVALLRMFEALAACELPLCVRAYHDATACLLQGGDRRVSGDLWKDHLIALAVHHGSAFARMAAAGRREEALWANMGEELSILGELSRLRSEDVARFAKERQQALALRPRQGKDAISVVSTAVWAGTAGSRPLPKEEPESGPSAPPIPAARFAFAPWRYGEPGLTDHYMADEALEEIYLRLLDARDWAELTEDLYGLFSAYGCGEFLRHRAFVLENDRLVPLPEEALAPLIPTSLYERERVALMENTIRFMRGDRAENALLYGGGGTGKTAHVLSLLHELPEVRLVLCRPEQGDIPGLIARLGAQPLRFVLLLDDVVAESKAMRGLASQLCGGRALPPNLLLYATSREDPGPAGLFTLALAFPYPGLAAFTSLAGELLESEGIQASYQSLHEACVDHQVDAREKLTFAGAQRVAESFKKMASPHF